MTNTRTTRRCAAAAAGFGMVLASVAGIAVPATAATHHGPVTNRLLHPDIVTPANAFSVSVGVPTAVPLATARAGTPMPQPAVTVIDPGLLPATGETINLSIFGYDGLSLTGTPTVSATGATAGTPVVTSNTISFTVTKTAATDHATFLVTGISFVGSPTTDPAILGMGADATHLVSSTHVMDQVFGPFATGGITAIIPATYGATAPDTAAALFASAVGGSADAVLASDSEPQDAESANYLASALHTATLLTDPATLSPAAAAALTGQDVGTVYIVGGTSVVSAAIQAKLTTEGYTVIRLAGADQYETNSAVVNYVTQNLNATVNPVALDYSQTAFNDTSGTSSATTTALGAVKTAIVASGSIDSFQDGIVSGPLSYAEGLPVILTTPGSLSSTAQQLLTEGGYKQVIVLGGPQAVSNTVVDQLTGSTGSGGAGVSVFRVAGADASETSTQLASFMLAGPFGFAPFDQGNPVLGYGGPLITRGTGFQDALAAGPYAGSVGHTPILLTENATTLGAPLAAYLKKNTLGAGSLAVQAIGGPLSVTPAVQQAAIDAEFSAVVQIAP